LLSGVDLFGHIQMLSLRDSDKSVQKDRFKQQEVLDPAPGTAAQSGAF
jgi:hypothetical protein